MATLEELTGWLAQAVPGPIARVDLRASPHIGSYDCHTVTVDFTNGAQRTFFLKDFARSRQSKDEPGRRRDREQRVYRDLLEGSNLGTPAYYGSLWDESRKRFWLLLERVDAEVVTTVDLRHAVPIAEWLATMQAHFIRQADRLGAADFLAQHDAAFYRGKAEAARRDVAAIAPESVHVLEHALANYERMADALAHQPQSLVHGGFIPWHILIDDRIAPTRVCVIDWELAARGSTLYDLAYFTDGADPMVRATMLEAYLRAAAANGVPIPEDPERVMASLGLHRILDWLSRAVEKSFSPKKTARLVTQIQARSVWQRFD